MKNVDIISNSLIALGLSRESCHYQVLSFFNEYQEKFNVHEFENLLSLKIQEQKGNRESPLKLFSDLNVQNWREIDRLAGQESIYYIFLRLKSFLLTIDFEVKSKKIENGWMYLRKNLFSF
ncbi:hypothetical protein [Chryseobacterium sp.]|uniref:hypothetical protein n=1 Tax=Chryseobacterium sp. TaxID=1871047 RepID=UPI00333EB31F